MNESAASLSPDITSSALAQVRELDSDGTLILEVIGLFATDAREIVGALQRTRWEDSPQEVIRLLHTLKSASGCVGADRVMQMASVYESRARSAGAAPSADEITAIAELVDRACEQLDQLVARDESLKGVS